MHLNMRPKNRRPDSVAGKWLRFVDKRLNERILGNTDLVAEDGPIDCPQFI